MECERVTHTSNKDCMLKDCDRNGSGPSGTTTRDFKRESVDFAFDGPLHQMARCMPFSDAAAATVGTMLNKGIQLL